MRSCRPLALLALLALGALGAAACGPSFQAVYECDVRFEHCYALDEGTVSIEMKKACWRDWLQGYTYGQSRDRVEYAGARLSELSLDPTLPSVDRGDPPPHASPKAAAPVPTNAFAPPPNLAEHSPADPPAPSASSSAVARAPTARMPGDDCMQSCQDRWKACHDLCKDGACTACDRTYKTCVPGCFR